MKKTRFLALALVVAVMLMGAGYAAWTDQLVINNTVETGELNVVFVEQEGSIYPPQGPYPIILAGDVTGNVNPMNCFTEVSIDQENQKLTTVKVENLYPGVMTYYHVKFQNIGTIPAKVDNIVINKLQTSEALDEEMVMFGGYTHYKLDGTTAGAPFLCTFENFEQTMNNLLAGIELKKGEFVTFDITDESKEQLNEMLIPYGITLPEEEHCIFMHLPAEGSTNASQGQTAEFQILLNFKQFNM
ncbi:MAG: SipW-dependent-type signal peptide-containing protein [Bacillota bacterium]